MSTKVVKFIAKVEVLLGNTILGTHSIVENVAEDHAKYPNVVAEAEAKIVHEAISTANRKHGVNGWDMVNISGTFQDVAIKPIKVDKRQPF
jgi:hypothetical protein